MKKIFLIIILFETLMCVVKGQDFIAKTWNLTGRVSGGKYIARDQIELGPGFICDPTYQGEPKIVEISWYCSNIYAGWYPLVTINNGTVKFEGPPMPENYGSGDLYNSVYNLIYQMSTYPDADWTVGVVTTNSSKMTIRITFNGDYSYSSNGTNVLIQNWIGPSSQFEASIDESLILDVVYNTSQPSMDRDLNKSLPVAYIPGNFSVSPNGAAIYSIPIVCPPGTGGMQPNISVVYNSMIWNGLLGVGWNLSGISSISRTGSTIYHDGETRGIELDGEDNYALDGQRLIIVSGSNGNYIFKTEINNYSVIKSYDSNSDGKIDYFKIWTKDGNILEYGMTSNSIMSIGENITWMLNKITNVHGNYIIYEYGKKLMEIFLKEIKYTGADNMDPYNSIQFFYEERTKDVFTTYKKGRPISYSLLLYKIRTICENKIVNEYLFNYHAESGDNYTYLTEIKLLNSNGDEINSTIFNWNKNNITWDSNNEIESLNAPIPGVHNRDKRLYTGDFDGNGITDIVKLYVYNVDQSTYIQKFYAYKPYSENDEPEFDPIGSPQILNDNVVLSYYSEQTGGLLINDFDNDGRDDIGYVKDFSGIGTNRIEINIPGRTLPIIITYNNFRPKCDICNFNGDGKNELFVFKEKEGSNNKEIYYYPDIMGDPEVITITQSMYNGQENPIKNVMAMDLNNDGRTDLIALCKYNLKIFYNITGYDDYYNQKYFKSSPDYINHDFTYKNGDAYFKVYPGDYNGDGLIDLLTYRPDHTWRLLKNIDGSFVTSMIYNMTAYDDERTDIDNEMDYCYIIDINKDGKSDIIQYDAQLTVAGATLLVDIKKYTFISTGSGFTLANTETIYDLGSCYAFMKAIGDFNGDGASDLVYYSEDNDKYYCNYSYNKFGANKISKIENGLGSELTIEYNRTSNASGCYKHMYSDEVHSLMNASDPLIDVKSPLTLVSKVIYSDGIGGTDYDIYKYYGAVGHGNGKGFLGFNKFEKINASTGKYNITEFTFAVTDGTNMFYQSLPISTESGVGGVKISKSIFAYNIAGTTSDIDKKIIFPYAGTVTVSDLLKGFRTEITNIIDNNGNITSSKIESYESNALITREIIAYSNYQDRITISGDLNTTPNAPEKVTVTKENHRDDGGRKYTRTKNFTYNNKGQVLTTLSDQGSTTSNEYYTAGVFSGLLKQTTLSAANFDSRYTSFEYDERGRFVTKETNSLGYFTEKSFDGKNGNVLWEKDIWGNISNYYYDGLGRLTLIKLPTGKTTTYSTNWYTGTDITNALYYSKVTPQGEPWVKVYYDMLGRELKTETLNGTGAGIFTVKTYNEKGEMISASIPTLNGKTPKYMTYEYDDYGRIKKEIFDGLCITEYTYTGNKTRISNKSVSPEQFVEKTIDAAGNVRYVTDNGGTITYYYHANGQVKRIEAPGSVIDITYDAYGYQQTLTDPDAGTIRYKYNPYGELVNQIDNRGNDTWIFYDRLGRVDYKIINNDYIDYEYYTTGDGKGLLKTVTGPNGIYDSYTYDKLGHTISKTSCIDASHTFTTNYQYDEMGRISEEIYPTGFGVYYIYNSYSTLAEVKRKDNNETIWKAGSMNEFNHWKDYALGKNLLKTQKSYDTYGYLLSIKTQKISDGTYRQDFSYRFNAVTGNLEWRSDNRYNGCLEYFDYDELNRLTRYDVNDGNVNVYQTYDNTKEGNILTKDLIGNYAYSSTHPHAVISVTNPQGYLSSQPQQISYTAFGKVSSITEGWHKYLITYGPDEQRRKSSYYYDMDLKYTKYYNEDYELHETYTGYRNLHYIYGGDGLAAIYETTNSGDELYYILKDHLGSYSVILNENGEIVEELSYDAWGRRRTVGNNPNNWRYNNLPAQFLFARGFTGHEHLDEFNLINMNGRVYDPYLGMFLSPDNYVQMPDATQGFNRYAYCFNNPLKYTDPSGEVFGVANAIIILAMAYFGGVQANFFHAAETGGNPFNPGDWNWKSANTYIGIGSGALQGYGMSLQHCEYLYDVSTKSSQLYSHIGDGKYNFIHYGVWIDNHTAFKLINSAVYDVPFGGVDNIIRWTSSMFWANFAYQTANAAASAGGGWGTSPQAQICGGGPGDVTTAFNNYLAETQRIFSAVGQAYDEALPFPQSYAVKLLYFKEVNTHDLYMNPKADPNSPFYTSGYYNKHFMRPDDFGNYNYGVAARALGFSPVEPMMGGGYGSFSLHGAHTWWNVPGFFDEWRDTQMILRGYFQLYK